jgi:uncharacterized protein YdeI (YjbR/CyaY-like superfamily)
LSTPTPNVADLTAPQSPNGKEVFTPPTRDDWRRWLADRPDRTEGVWVVYRKKDADLFGPLYDDLVEEALCFGWIDSKVLGLDESRRLQWFSPRRRGGLWSPLNKQRIERLVAQGLMAEPGQRVIDEAIADGSWSQADEVEALVIPGDLAAAMDRIPGVREAFDAMAPSAKKQDLWLIHSAKREETRVDRIESLVQRLKAGS